jgi:hypothetical protein
MMSITLESTLFAGCFVVICEKWMLTNTSVDRSSFREIGSKTSSPEVFSGLFQPISFRIGDMKKGLI